MIAPTEVRRKGRFRESKRNKSDGLSGSPVTGSLEGIIIPPHFRQPPAVLDWEKVALRWLGPFGFGFLSPQPPGIVGIGPNAATVLGPTQVGPFVFWCKRCLWRAQFDMRRDAELR